jgi:hypothetical protein
MDSDCLLSAGLPKNKYIINQNLKHVDDVCLRNFFVEVLVFDKVRVSPFQNKTYVPTLAIRFYVELILLA